MGELFVIGDLHFSRGVDKPMDIFGKAWENHTERLCENWRRIVGDEDVVVVNGDISWGLDLQEAVPDLLLLDSLPGTKIIMKGNHELWWTTMAKVRSVFKEHDIKTLRPLYNNAYLWPEKAVLICGTRGWNVPGDEGFGENDAKIYRREMMRFESSLAHGRKLAANYYDFRESLRDDLGADPCEIIGPSEQDSEIPGRNELETLAFTHFPPFVFAKRECNEFTDLIEKNNISRCYFGHIHGMTMKERENGGLPPVWRKNGVAYFLTAADYLKMEPVIITGTDI